MTTYITHTTDEAAGLHDCTITLLVVPMEPQPPFHAEDAYSFRSDLAGGKRDCRTFKSRKYPRSGLHNFPVTCPYAKGDEIQVEGADTRLLCQSVEARQVQSITHDMAAMAMPLLICEDGEDSYYEVGSLVTDDPVEAFRAEWNRRHPDQPWEANPWAFFTTVKRKD